MAGKTWYEEFKISGDAVLAKVRELIQAGNVRRVFIKNDRGDTLLELPLNTGLAVTGVAALVAPALVAVGAVAALLTQVTIGVEREGRPGEGTVFDGEVKDPAAPAESSGDESA
ncbi:DUF4342 domain-containing protein [Rarobacter faecitabidus]|uniref:Uncharacterized protein DUF4342 n=1 Tax=Rarobacter faecitabidus TaxID=13243 RepID=A0A542ZP80_RARFA|nr:DUF4342 domain-containing protein [Rarobacter faecitabidus]TQL62127.1 uncharacterized protein DUF4342 [Rarobacter faecitabidus]